MQLLKGYSLLEILMVMVIATLAGILIFPSQKYLTQATHAELAASELYDALQIARNEAILRQRSVSICKSLDQQNCSGEWHDGFVVKMGRAILFSHRYSLPQGKIYWRAFPNETRHLVFLPSGFSKVQNGTFWFCFERNENPQWAIVLNQSGRLRRIDPDRFGNIYDDNNKALKCVFKA